MEKFEEKENLGVSSEKNEEKEITQDEARKKMAKKYGLSEDATWVEIQQAIINNKPREKRG